MHLPISPTLDFSEIPVIDLAPLISNSDLEATVRSLSDACRRVGFFYVENHGVNPETVSRLHQQAQLFFNQSMAQKEQLLVDYRMRGYLPLFYRSFEGEEHAATSHQEEFWVGHETPESYARPLDGPNRWPAQLNEFRAAMENYFDELETLSKVLLRGFARSLEVEEELLLGMFKTPTTRLKLNHYPPQDYPTDDHNIGVVPHSDSGAFTILWQDGHGGLEVQNKKKEWVGAPPIDDTFVVNLGSIMQFWSGGNFPATVHRVINRSGNDRYSIPLFVNPSHDVIIRPLIGDPSISDDAFVYGEYQTKFWRRAFPIAHTATS